MFFTMDVATLFDEDAVHPLSYFSDYLVCYTGSIRAHDDLEDGHRGALEVVTDIALVRIWRSLPCDKSQLGELDACCANGYHECKRDVTNIGRLVFFLDDLSKLLDISEASILSSPSRLFTRYIAPGSGFDAITSLLERCQWNQKIQ